MATHSSVLAWRMPGTGDPGRLPSLGSHRVRHDWSDLAAAAAPPPGKTTRPFNHDLNQTPYDYTMKVTNRFKRLDLIDRVPEELWMEVHDFVQETVIKTIPKNKKGKMAVWGGLTNSWEKKRHESQRSKGNIYPFECRVPKNSKERHESLPQWSMQRNRGKQQNGKDEISSRKLEIPREHFMQRWAR